MDINYYTKYDRGFQLLCELQPSDRYTQGIELKDVRLLTKKMFYSNQEQ